MMSTDTLRGVLFGDSEILDVLFGDSDISVSSAKFFVEKVYGGLKEMLMVSSREMDVQYRITKVAFNKCSHLNTLS